jgi:ubiquitin C-terminal hydrolase
VQLKQLSEDLQDVRDEFCVVSYRHGSCSLSLTSNVLLQDDFDRSKDRLLECRQCRRLSLTDESGFSTSLCSGPGPRLTE